MQSTMLKAIVEDFGNGGTIDGDLVVSGDLQVSGGGSLSFDEIVQGTQVVEITNTEALLVRKASDGGDVFIVDTTNSKVSITDTLNLNPTISSGSKTSLAFQRSGANKWRFIQPHDDSYLKLYNDGASATQMYFASNNNIGINTNAPKHYSGTSGTVLSIHDSSYRGVLELSGASNSDGGVIGALTFANTENTSANGALAQLYTEVETSDSNAGDDSGGHLLFFTKPEAGTLAERMRIDSSGNILFGATTAFARMYLQSNVVDQTGLLIKHAPASSSGASVGIFSADNSSATATNGVLRVHHEDPPANVKMIQVDTNAGNVVKFSVDEDGDGYFAGSVGIGTASPSQLLHIQGTAGLSLLESTGANQNAEFQFKTTARIFGIGQNIGTTGKFEIYDRTAGNTRLVVDGSGNVGIGTTSPSEALEINKSGANLKVVSDDNVYLSLKTTQSNGKEWQVFNANSGSDSTLQFKNIDASKVVMLMTDSGKIGVNSVAPVATMDIVGDRTINLTNTTSDDTNKNAVITHSHYDSGTRTQGFTMMMGFSSSSTNRIDIGGGTSQHYAAKEIKFHTASNTTTFTGTARMVIDDNSRISLSNNDSGTSNTVFGYEAGKLIGSGDNYNVFIGHQVADADMTDATQNVGMGYQALTSLTTGDSNTGVGSGSLYNLTTGNYNVAMGHLSADAVTTSQYNVAIGYDALGAEVTRGTAVAIGYGALQDQTHASDGANSENVGVGFLALAENVTGTSNTSVGFEAMKGASGQSNSNNTAIGSKSMLDVTTGSNNVAVGKSAGENLTSGGNSVMIGNEAGHGVSTSYYHVLIGDHAGHKTLADHGTTAIGYYALANATSGGYNTAIGYQSLEDNVAGEFNVGLGYQTLKEANSSQNTAIGYQSGMDVTSGVANTFVGSSSGFNITTGGNNVAVGDTALANATDSSNVVAIGIYAGLDINHADADGSVLIGRSAGENITSGQKNTAIGFNALSANCDIGDANTAVGYEALKNFDPSSDGHGLNTAVGTSAGEDVSTGTGNTLIGDKAGNTGSNDITTGTLNTVVGQLSGISASGGTNQTVIGRGVTGQGDNSVTLGNADVTAVYMAQDSRATMYAGGLSVDNGTGIVNRGNSTGDIFEARGLNAPQMKITTSAFTVTPNASFTGEVFVNAGINFPDTQTTSADANTLDDYEEGSFTPVWSAASGTLGTINYTSRIGRYTKIGDVVHFSISFYNAAFDAGSGSGQARLSGLPFTCNSTNGKSACSVGISQYFTGQHPSTAEVLNNQTSVDLLYRDSADGATALLQVADLQAGGSGVFNLINVSGTYFV